MKIEKVNENQICCTLTKEDLANRQMRLSELAYGSEKAKRLFREVIRQASYECGFEPEDFPIMVEAIPMPEESIIVLITKVEYPEELDARFSDFSAFDQEDTSLEDVLEDVETQLGSVDDAVDCQIFEFGEMGQAEKLADLVGDFYQGNNSLYRMESEGKYALVLYRSSHTKAEFSRICNLAAEFGHAKAYSPSIYAHYREHGKVILSDLALQLLKGQLLTS